MQRKPGQGRGGLAGRVIFSPQTEILEHLKGHVKILEGTPRLLPFDTTHSNLAARPLIASNTRRVTEISTPHSAIFLK